MVYRLIMIKSQEKRIVRFLHSPLGANVMYMYRDVSGCIVGMVVRYGGNLLGTLLL